MISVVIPLYNKESLVGDTIKSVLNQTFQDFEIVVVDDGSTDNGPDIVRNINDPRIRLISQKNAGVSAARNRGIEEAKGEYIALLDADDEWKPEYLSTQMMLAETYPECDVFAVNYENSNKRGESTPTIIRNLPFSGEHGILSNYFEVASISHPPLWTSAVMVSKRVLKAVGGFPVGIKSGEDLLTWARLACQYKIAYFRRSVARFISDSEVINEDRIQRMPEKDDVVGKELNILLKRNPSVAGLRDYVALWHKMRCRVFLQKGCKLDAIKECFKSSKLSLNKRIIVFGIMTVLPTALINKIFNRMS